MSQASPFLLSLGVSKSMMSVVFLAGPLSGLIVQPLVGHFSDACKSSLGRRRPFIIAGCALTSVSVMTFGWSREIAAVFAEEGGTLHQHLAIACAVISVYVIDFAVNIVQAMDRALLVDVVAPAQQPAANAWASRMFGFGAVFGYWIGGLDLVWLTRGWLGSEQLKVLTFFTSFFLLGTHAITCSCVSERVLISRDEGPGGGGALAALEDIWHTIRTLPRPIRQVFDVQFTSWIGWFPVLFFSTTWVAEIYVKTRWGDAESELASAPTDVRDAATRAGTRAMLWHSVVNLATSILVPPLVEGGGEKSETSGGRGRGWRAGGGREGGRFEAVRRFLPDLPIKWLSIPLLWTASNGFFAMMLLFGTYFSTTVAGATFVLASIGFSWSITNWAPFAILGDILTRSNSTPPSLSPNASAIMLQNTYNTSRDHIALSPIPEEASDYASSNHSSAKLASRDGPFQRDPRALNSSSNPFSLGSPNDSGDEIPFTPTTAASNYFDASSSIPSSSRAESFVSSSSVGSGVGSPSFSSTGSRTPTLTASPQSSPGRRRNPNGARHDRADSSVSAVSAVSAASSFAYPPNHGSVGLDLLGESMMEGRRGGNGPRSSKEEFFSADPYSYHGAGRGAGGGEGGSSSTIHLPLHQQGGGAGGRRGSGPPLHSPDENDETVLQIRHSDSFDLSADERTSYERLDAQRGGGEPETPSTIRPGGGFVAGGGEGRAPRIMVGGGENGEETEEWEGMDGEEDEDVEQGLAGGSSGGGGDQTGVILGCHNIFLVLPQFLVTGLSSIIFALLAPHHSVVGAGAHHGAGVTLLKGSANSTSSLASTAGSDSAPSFTEGDADEYRAARVVVRALAGVGEAMMGKRQEGPAGSGAGWDALGLIFRIGGISAIFSTYIAFRMWREKQRAAERQRAVGRGWR
ncbi:hypothetical protein JCM8547_006582 [Rhodosporidiobolus lusitaniae]